METNRKISFFDSTLREGEQMAGICFDAMEKKRIVERLVKAGIANVELGILNLELDSIHLLKKNNLLDYISVTVLISIDEVKKAHNLGIKTCNLLIPANEQFSNTMMSKGIMTIKREVIELLKLFRDSNIAFNLVLADASRTPIEELIKFTQDLLQEQKVNMVLYCDTIGILTPLQIFKNISYYKKLLPNGTKIGIHCHNDFGLATANTLAAIEAGADIPVVSINGYGERSGIADLCEVAVGCKYLLHIDNDINIKEVLNLSSKLQKLTGITISPISPIKGNFLYRYESGIPIHMIKKKPRAFEAIPSEDLERERKFIYGKHSGRTVLKEILKKHEIDMNQNLFTEFRSRIREVSMRKMKQITSQLSGLIEDYNRRIQLLGLTEAEVIAIALKCVKKI